MVKPTMCTTCLWVREEAAFSCYLMILTWFKQVVFLPPSPVHPHIYSNGHICLDILYDGESQTIA